MPQTVPAAVRTLAVLRLLAESVGPLPATAIARHLDVPRSSMYQLLTEMQSQGFTTYFPEDRTWGLGVSVFEVGSAYLRHDPLEHLARPLLQKFVADSPHPVAAHLGILHGRETLYLVKEVTMRATPVVTDVGVRLPAQLTATGRAILSQLGDAEVRALFPSRATFIDRTGKGPASLNELMSILQKEKRAGHSIEDGYITDGFMSVAVPVSDRSKRAIAAVSATISKENTESVSELITRLTELGSALTKRLSGLR